MRSAGGRPGSYRRRHRAGTRGRDRRRGRSCRSRATPAPRSSDTPHRRRFRSTCRTRSRLTRIRHPASKAVRCQAFLCNHHRRRWHPRRSPMPRRTSRGTRGLSHCTGRARKTGPRLCFRAVQRCRCRRVRSNCTGRSHHSRRCSRRHPRRTWRGIERRRRRVPPLRAAAGRPCRRSRSRRGSPCHRPLRHLLRRRRQRSEAPPRNGPRARSIERRGSSRPFGTERRWSGGCRKCRLEPRPAAPSIR
jgi:hypothetical protein